MPSDSEAGEGRHWRKPLTAWAAVPLTRLGLRSRRPLPAGAGRGTHAQWTVGKIRVSVSATRVRFAPSPTGRLHVGNVRAALANWLFARKAGGAFILRLDDTDRERSTEEFARGIEEDLAWIGLDWHEHLKQSSRLPRYAEAAERLQEKGLLYPCYETEEELQLQRS
jgi:glutamyl/glutaminyl-tRNA synthetase